MFACQTFALFESFFALFENTTWAFCSILTSPISISVFVAISQDGRLTTNAYMAEYNQDRFELEIQAKEVQPPERIAMAKVFVSIVAEHFISRFFCMHNVHT